eukprot:TRINITY_DN1956_c0_g1_i1.p1 TRINITY_DN1956_c0_g1~~TRINITY_DN1956_c0_g1_i1.p1  ORF type:complete len:731 (+),score=128.58 TRINITY_DN1956_c0_g1_i1:63-2255(+)
MSLSATQLQEEQALLLEALVQSLPPGEDGNALQPHETSATTASHESSADAHLQLHAKGGSAYAVGTRGMRMGGGILVPADQHAALTGGLGGSVASGPGVNIGVRGGLHPSISVPQHAVPSLAHGLTLTPDPHRVRRPRSHTSRSSSVGHPVHPYSQSSRSYMVLPPDTPRKRGRKPKALLQQLSAAAAAQAGVDPLPIPNDASDKAYLFQTYYTMDAKLYPEVAIRILDQAANKPNPDFGPASDFMPRRKRGSLKAEMLARAPETFYPAEPWAPHPLAPADDIDQIQDNITTVTIDQGDNLDQSSVVVVSDAGTEADHMMASDSVSSALGKKVPPASQQPIPHVNIETVVGPLPEPDRMHMDHSSAMDQAPYIPKALLRLHSYQNNPEDTFTHVWYSSFYKSQLQGSSEYNDVLVTAGGCNLCFYDCDTGRLLKRFQCLKKDDLYVFDWALFGETKEEVFVAGGRHGILHVIVPKQNACIESLRTGLKEIHSLRFLKNNRNILLVGSGDGALQAWKIRGLDESQQSECVASFVGHKKAISSLAVSPSGKLIVSGDRTGAIRVWDVDEALVQYSTDPNISQEARALAKKRSRAIFTFHYSAVDDLQFISEHVLVSKGSADSCILLWKLEPPGTKRSDPSYRVFRKVLHRPAEEFHHKFCVCRETQQFVTSNSHGEITIFGMAGETIDQYPYAILAFKGQTSTIRSVCMSDDGKYIASTNDQNLVAIWMKRA